MFVKIKFKSSKTHNTDCDILEGWYNNDTFITYVICKDGKESMEYYSGDNYTGSGSDTRSISRFYESNKIPTKYKKDWELLKSEYEMKYKSIKEAKYLTKIEDDYKLDGSETRELLNHLRQSKIFKEIVKSGYEEVTSIRQDSNATLMFQKDETRYEITKTGYLRRTNDKTINQLYPHRSRTPLSIIEPITICNSLDDYIDRMTMLLYSFKKWIDKNDKAISETRDFSVNFKVGDRVKLDDGRSGIVTKYDGEYMLSVEVDTGILKIDLEKIKVLKESKSLKSYLDESGNIINDLQYSLEGLLKIITKESDIDEWEPIADELNKKGFGKQAYVIEKNVIAPGVLPKLDRLYILLASNKTQINDIIKIINRYTKQQVKESASFVNFFKSLSETRDFSVNFKVGDRVKLDDGRSGIVTKYDGEYMLSVEVDTGILKIDLEKIKVLKESKLIESINLRKITIGHMTPGKSPGVTGDVVSIRNEDLSIQKIIDLFGLTMKPKKIGESYVIYDDHSDSIVVYEKESDIPKQD